MVLAVNFGAEPALLDVPAELEPVLTVGDLDAAPDEAGRIRLGPHSALVGRRPL